MKRISITFMIFIILIMPVMLILQTPASAEGENLAITDMAILTALGLGGVALHAGQDGLAMTAQNFIDDIKANAPAVYTGIQNHIDEQNRTMLITAGGAVSALWEYLSQTYQVGTNTKNIVNTVTGITPVSGGVYTGISGYTLSYTTGATGTTFYISPLDKFGVGSRWSSVAKNANVTGWKIYHSTSTTWGVSAKGTYIATDGKISDQLEWTHAFEILKAGVTAYNSTTKPIDYTAQAGAAIDNGADWDLGGSISAGQAVTVTIPQNIDDIGGLTWEQILQSQIVIDNAQDWANARVAEIDVIDGRIVPWPLPIDWPLGYTGEWSYPSSISADGTITDTSTIILTLAGAQAVTATTTLTVTGEIIDTPAGEIHWDKLIGLGTLVSTKFPFCIPFDLVNAFLLLGGNDEFDFKFEYDLTDTILGKKITVDLNIFKPFIPMIKTVELLIVTIGTMLATRKLLGGGV